MVEIEKRYTLNERIKVTVCRNIEGVLTITLNMIGIELMIKCMGILREGDGHIRFSRIYSLVKNRHFRIILCMFLEILRIMISRNNITVSQLVLVLERMLLT